MPTFEEIAATLEGLPEPPERDQFHVEWLAEGRVAVGKDGRSRHSVLIVGSTITPAIEIVASSMRNGRWLATSGQVVEGNLLQLPAGDAFRTAAATIAAEMFRRGVEARPPGDVFAEVESFVALVLRRILLPEEHVLGLVGELLVLRDLLSAFGDRLHSIEDPTSCWRGWQRQSRDFLVGNTAIEVKTTGLSVSRHTVSGFEQIEPRKIDGDALEDLYLASIGLRVSYGSGLSIASLSDQILELLRPSTGDTDDARASREKFLDRLRQYGPEGFEGYRHAEMRERPPYTQAFTTTFSPRVYDMADENVRILRKADLTRDFPFVLPQGVRYTLELPDAIPGSIENPRTDLAAFLSGIARETFR